MRLPKRLVFPFGYVVAFKFLTAAEMKLHEAAELDGYWDPDSRTIYLRRRLPVKRLRYMVGHEMDHAINDYRHHLTNEGIAEG